jgi:hypothetical protein
LSSWYSGDIYIPMVLSFLWAVGVLEIYTHGSFFPLSSWYLVSIIIFLFLFYLGLVDYFVSTTLDLFTYLFIYYFWPHCLNIFYWLGFRVITTKEYCSISSFFLLSQKSNKRLMAGTITRETKKGWPKKGQKTHSPQEPKKMERASPSHSRKLSHPWPL